MNLSFAYPAGFWALLALPAVLAIHFLQRESRCVVTSTLFLFEALGPVSARGRRFERLRQSLPLWLQLLAVLLTTWLLAEPRWLRPDSSQRVVVVLDSSVSMLAFREDLDRLLAPRLRDLARTAAKTEWRLLETDPARPTLYAGTDLRGLRSALAGWKPRLGTHDFLPALDAARSLTRDAGAALFVTDRRTEVPEGVKILGVGHPIDNCGWVGVSVDGAAWRALVRNHSLTPQTRAWHLEADGTASREEMLTLEPGQTRTLSGTFPPGKDRCELVLSADAFPLDDRLPIVRPRFKRLGLLIAPATPLDGFLQRLARSVPDAETVPQGADVRLGVYATGPTAGHALLFALQEWERPDYLPGELAAENHPLTAGLNWNGLICKATDPIPRQDGDEVLLWQGERPLIFLRGGQTDRSLLVNFDVRQSNADRLPAFVVLLDRFLESIRAEKVAFEQRNVQTDQLLDVASDPAGPAPQVSGGDSFPLRAPAAPGFFHVIQGSRTLFAGAADFSDARQADFRAAASFDTLAEERARLLARHSRQDLLWPVFALLLGGALLANWADTGAGAGRPAVKRGLPA